MQPSPSDSGHKHNGSEGNHGGAMGSGGESGGMMGQGHGNGGMMGSGHDHSPGGMMGGDQNHNGEMMGSAQDHNGHFPALQVDQVFLCGTVTNVNGNLFTLLNGAFLVDATGVAVQSMSMHEGAMHGSSPAVVPTTLQAGQRVALVGQFESRDTGTVLKPTLIRVMDSMHEMMDPGHGSVAGTLISVDPCKNN